MVPGRRETARLASWGVFVSMGGGITTHGADDKAPPCPCHNQLWILYFLIIK